MKKHLSLIIVLGVFLALYWASNYYVYYNLVQGFELTGPLKWILGFGFLFLSVLYIISWFLRAKASISIISYLGASWMGVLAISFTVFFIKDLLRLIIPLDTDLFPIAFGFVLLLIALSLLKVLWGPKIKKISLQHPKIQNKSLKIVHLSDLHLGVLTSPKWLKKVVKQINLLEADLIVITGDLTDDSFYKIKQFVPIMKNLQSKNGVFAVAGNHEYYTGLDSFNQFCLEAGIKVLHNSSIIIDDLHLIGIADEVSNQPALFKNILQELLGQSNPNLYNVLLIHQPIYFRQAVDLGIDLQLSGHTHQGQLPPMTILVRLAYQYAYGLHIWQDAHIYTTSGTGTWGPPMRLLSNSEIVLLTVKI